MCVCLSFFMCVMSLGGVACGVGNELVLWSDMSISWCLSCCGGWVWSVWTCHCRLWCHFLWPEALHTCAGVDSTSTGSSDSPFLWRAKEKHGRGMVWRIGGRGCFLIICDERTWSACNYCSAFCPDIIYFVRMQTVKFDSTLNIEFLDCQVQVMTAKGLLWIKS